MSAPKPQGFATASIHAGYDPDSLYGAINTPIYASTTFAQNGLNELRGGYEYTRCGNPTIAGPGETRCRAGGCHLWSGVFLRHGRHRRAAAHVAAPG